MLSFTLVTWKHLFIFGIIGSVYAGIADLNLNNGNHISASAVQTAALHAPQYVHVHDHEQAEQVESDTDQAAIWGAYRLTFEDREPFEVPFDLHRMKFKMLDNIDLIYLVYLYRGRYTESIISPQNVTLASGMQNLPKVLDKLLQDRKNFGFPFKFRLYSYIWAPAFVILNTLIHCGLLVTNQCLSDSDVISQFVSKPITLVAFGLFTIINTTNVYLNSPVFELPYSKELKDFFVNCFTTCLAINVVLIIWVILYYQPPKPRSPRSTAEE